MGGVWLTMAEFKPGTPVVINGRGRFRHERHEGTVTRVSSKSAWAVFDEPWTSPEGVATTREHEVCFDMESGLERGVPEYWVRTVEQAERDERKREAIYRLNEAGIEFKLGTERFLTVEQVEALAEVTKGWEADR